MNTMQPGLSPKATRTPEYDPDVFKENYPEWQAAVERGETTPSDIIDDLTSRKTLSESMLKDIRGLADCVPVQS